MDISSSNHKNQIEKMLDLSAELSDLWESSKIKDKERLQKLIFRDGVLLDSEKKTVRTTKVNSIFELIGLINKDLEEIKNEKSSIYRTLLGHKILFRNYQNLVIIRFDLLHRKTNIRNILL